MMRSSSCVANAILPARPDDHSLTECAAPGRFADVTPVDRNRTFWRAACALFGEEGDPLAEAVIVFRGGAEWSARQMPYFKARTDAGTFARMFPSYV